MRVVSSGFNPLFAGLTLKGLAIMTRGSDPASFNPLFAGLTLKGGRTVSAWTAADWFQSPICGADAQRLPRALVAAAEGVSIPYLRG